MFVAHFFVGSITNLLSFLNRSAPRPTAVRNSKKSRQASFLDLNNTSKFVILGVATEDPSSSSEPKIDSFKSFYKPLFSQYKAHTGDGSSVATPRACPRLDRGMTNGDGLYLKKTKILSKNRNRLFLDSSIKALLQVIVNRVLGEKILGSSYKCLRVFFLLIFFLPTNIVYSAVPGFIKSIKVLHVNSVKQKIINQDVFIFEGEVEVIVEQKLHLWADRIELNKTAGTLIAERVDQGPVVLENKDLIFLADRIFLDFNKKTGYADNMSIHVDEGYLSASRAEKLSDTDWCMNDMIYTPCDSKEPHWHFKAKKAKVHGSYFVRATNLVFKVGGVPLLALPQMVFPIQGRSKSGFLIPKFSYDYEFGFGVKQEYYWHIHRHCDTTLGVDWREKRGVVFSDEFRLARAPENYTILNSWYAVVKDSIVQRKGEILKATDRRYWFSGQDFRGAGKDILGADIYSLARVDFGTDKRIGYTFFNSLDEVDDTFCDSWILRAQWPQDLFEIKCDDAKTSRKRFISLSQQEQQWVTALSEKLPTDSKISKNICIQKKELEDRVNVTYLPHLEWNTAFKNWGKFFSYRHDLFLDQVFYRQRENERFYVNSLLIDDSRLIPFSKTDVLRFCYRGNLHKALYWHSNMIKATVQPHIQLRSHILQDQHLNQNVLEYGVFGKGACRFFCDYGLEWAMPEGVLSNESGNYIHYIQPIVSWEYVPKFYQDHWFYIDRRDKTYSKNELAFGVRNNFVLGNSSCDVHLSQGIDFYKQEDIFYLRRGIRNDHLLPFRYDVGWTTGILSAGVAQEVELNSMRLLQSEVHTGLFFNKFHINLGYLFQHEQLQQRRNLLSNIPHFLAVSLAVPLSKQATLSYDAQFYSENDKHFAQFLNIKPLLHRVRLDYDGHCWGFYIGFENKQYREYGVDRSEKAFVFAFRLESLGSFAKKFRGVQALRTT